MRYQVTLRSCDCAIVPAMLSWIVGAVCLLANLAAVLSLVAGRRADKPRRYAVRSALCALATVAAAVIGYVAGVAGGFGAVANADASEKAALLARAISEAMNLAAFALVATIVPVGVTIVLLMTTPRARPQAR